MRPLFLILLFFASLARGQRVAYAAVANQDCVPVSAQIVVWVWVENPYSTWSTNLVMPGKTALWVPIPAAGYNADGSPNWRIWVNGVLNPVATGVAVGSPCSGGVVRTNSVGFVRVLAVLYRDWETDRKSTRLNSSHSRASRMPSSA